jgi:hypothetical protein
MKNRLFPVIILSVIFATGASAQGEILYGITPLGIIYKVNPETCEYCPVLDVGPYTPDFGIYDLVVLPDGNILVITGTGLSLFNPPSPAPVWSAGDVFIGAILGTDGLVYLSTPGNGGYDAGLSVYDPASNDITFIGYWPSAMIVQEFFYQNGVLYAHATQGPGNWVNKVVQVDLADPGNTVIVQQTPPFNLAGGTQGGFTNNGYSTQIYGTFALYQYDAASNGITQKCVFPTNVGLAGLAELPAGVAEAACICLTFAGTVTPNVIKLCFNQNVAVPYNNNANLENGDALQYILFSNPADTLGSIILQSNSPIFAFNPATMQTGVTYYLATIAGNKVNNAVDLNDPCLDISNTAAQVIWQPQPTVGFAATNPDLCAGACLNLDVTLTGSAVFYLSGNLLSGGNVVGTFSKTFVTNSGTLEICAPNGVAPGNLQVQATSLVDAYCSCL